MKNWNRLHDVCYANARKIYGRLLPAFVKESLEEELKYIQKKGWAKEFLEAAEFMSGDYFTRDDRFNKGFRGSLGASFVAYLCNITTMNPLELRNSAGIGLYCRLFYEKEKLTFYINLPDRIIKTIEKRGVEVPECMCLLSSKNLTLLDQLQRATGEKYYCNIQSDLKDIVGNHFWLFLYEDKFDEKGYPMAGKALAECVPEFEFGGKLLLEVLDTTRLYDGLPKTIADIAPILGLVHGQGTWMDNARELYVQFDYEGKRSLIDEYLITCAEDIYERMLQKGFPDDEAIEIMQNVSKGNRQLTSDDLHQIEKAGYDELFMDVIQRIDYLFSRAQCIQYAWEMVRIIYYLRYFKEQYMQVIDYQPELT